MNFADFDARGYPTVDVRTGYGQWVDSYEDTVEDVMDLALLAELTVPDWAAVKHTADLGCGTGRTTRWLRENGVGGVVDGVDLTPEMLAVARQRGNHDSLTEADVTATGLADGRYDLVIASLIDEHLADLRPFYAEAFRIAAPGALTVIVAFHPHFIMTTGMPTHFTTADGDEIAITTHVHLVGVHQMAAIEAGWQLAEIREGIVDDRWVAVKPKWDKYRGHPVSYAQVWRKPSDDE